MNRVIIIGRLTQDVDLRYTTGDNPLAVGKFTVAVDRKFKKEGQLTADFISCAAFGKLAENIEKFFKKGNKICIEGYIQTGSYTNKDGNRVYTTTVIAETMEFVESKGQAVTSNSNAVKSNSKSKESMDIKENSVDEGEVFNIF